MCPVSTWAGKFVSDTAMTRTQCQGFVRAQRCPGACGECYCLRPHTQTRFLPNSMSYIWTLRFISSTLLGCGVESHSEGRQKRNHLRETAPSSKLPAKLKVHVRPLCFIMVCMNLESSARQRRSTRRTVLDTCILPLRLHLIPSKVLVVILLCRPDDFVDVVADLDGTPRSTMSILPRIQLLALRAD